jgi:hypothetical protein
VKRRNDVNFKKINATILITLLLLFTAFTYANENQKNYYQKTISLNEFHSLPISIGASDPNIPASLIDTGQVLYFRNILDTRFFDEDYPAVEIESRYKVIDIVELTSKNLYVLAEKKDKIIKVFSKNEFDKFYNEFNKNNIYISYLNGGYSVFDNTFRTLGVKGSLNSESTSSIRLFEGDMEKFKITSYNSNGRSSILSYNGYYTPIGNVIAGKYLVELSTLRENHPEFCELISLNTRPSGNIAEEISIPDQWKSNYYGSKFKAYSNFLKNSKQLEYVSKDTYKFAKITDFSKFLDLKQIEGPIVYSTNRIYRIHKILTLDNHGSIKSEFISLLDVTKERENTSTLISSVEEATYNTGVRAVIDKEGIHMVAISNYGPKQYNTEIINSNSILYNMTDYQLMLLSIYRDD